MPNYLVTGGAGFIGSHIQECFNYKRFAKEHRLVLLAARAKLPSDDIAELILSGVRWEEVIKYAGRTGILPIVAYNLSSNKKIWIPEDVKQHLKRVLFMTTAKNLQMYQVLARVVSVLQKEGIDVIILKGPYLAATVYPNIGTRAFCDLDLLVRRIDLPKVEYCFNTMDFSIQSEIQFSREFYERHFHLPFTDDKGSIVEIHWDFEEPIRFSNKNIIREFWANAEKKSFESLDAKVLSPEDTLLALCLHNARHNLSMLSIFSDIDKLVSFYKKRLNWEKLILTAKKHALSRVVYTSLFYVASLFDTDIPDEVLRQLEPKRYVKKILQSEICRALVLNETESELDGIRNVIRVALMERREIRFRYIFRYIFLPLEMLASIYKVNNDRLVFIYYIVRPFWVFKNALLVCFRARKLIRYRNPLTALRERRDWWNHNNPSALKGFPQQAFFELCEYLLKKGKELTFTVVSDCMKPQIERGDEIKVRYAHPDEIAFGDIVLCKSHQGFITHRILWKRFVDGRKLFLHKGDNSRHIATIPAAQVIAKAVLIKKADRRIRLDTTKGKLVNYIFGFRSIVSVFIRQIRDRKFAEIKSRLLQMRKMPSF